MTGNCTGRLELIACVAGLLAAGDADPAASPGLSVCAMRITGLSSGRGYRHHCICDLKGAAQTLLATYA